MNIDEIQNAVRGLPRASNGKIVKVPDALKTEIISQSSCFEMGVDAFAKEIGLSYTTIVGWKTKPRKSLGRKPYEFRQVKIKSEPRIATFTVEGTRGLKIPGLSLSEIAVLIREVNREF